LDLAECAPADNAHADGRVFDGERPHELHRPLSLQRHAYVYRIALEFFNSWHRFARAERRHQGCARGAGFAGLGRTDGAVGLVSEIARQKGIDYEAAKQILMHSLGGIPIASRRKWLISLPSSFRPAPARSLGTEYVIDGGTVPTV
jgi:hypothetical protein